MLDSHRTLEPGFPHAASLGAPHRHSLSILLTAAPGGSGVGVGAKWCLAVVSTCVALATEESQRAVLTFTGEPGIFPDVTAAAVGGRCQSGCRVEGGGLVPFLYTWRIFLATVHHSPSSCFLIKCLIFIQIRVTARA